MYTNCQETVCRLWEQTLLSALILRNTVPLTCLLD